MKEFPPAFRRGDVPFLGALLLLTLAAWWLLLRLPDTRATHVEIVGPGRESHRYALPTSGARTISVSGPLGVSLIRLLPSEAHFVDSPCPYKICVGAGALCRSGQTAACVPNGVVVHVVSGPPPLVDAITR